MKINGGKGADDQGYKTIDADVIENTQRALMRAPIFSRGSPMGGIISGQKAPIGRILRNVLLRMRTRLPSPSDDLRSLQGEVS
jgi:hypothetical protein